MPLLYRTKPVTVEAVQWTGANFDEIIEWFSSHEATEYTVGKSGQRLSLCFECPEMGSGDFEESAEPTDWVVRQGPGFHVMPDEDFAETRRLQMTYNHAFPPLQE
jgi:hypothetical protein